MVIYAKIEDGRIVTSEEPGEGFEEFVVKRIEQLYISYDFSEEEDMDLEEMGEERTSIDTIKVKPFQDFKLSVEAQIENVYTFLISKPEYDMGTKANMLLEKAKEEALLNTEFLSPPTTDEEEEALYLIEFAKANKLAELKAAKKAIQNAPVTSKIGSKDYHFYGGADSIGKYSSAMNLTVALGKQSREILTLEGLVEITKPDMDVAIIKMSMILDDAWHKEIGYIMQVYGATTVKEVEAIVWKD